MFHKLTSVASPTLPRAWVVWEWTRNLAYFSSSSPPLQQEREQEEEQEQPSRLLEFSDDDPRVD